MTKSSAALQQRGFRAAWSASLAAKLLAVFCTVPASVTGVAASDSCLPPVTSRALRPTGSGDAIRLQWDAPATASRFRIWAQWRVPEGEVLRTHEVVVDQGEVLLPPSPARWRPLKLSVEIQALCPGGAVSAITAWHQLQFDAASQAACPEVDGLRFDLATQRLVWKGEKHDRVALSFHRAADGQMQAQQDLVGNEAAWPAQANRPTVIRAVRACGEAQRSRATFLLVR